MLLLLLLFSSSLSNPATSKADLLIPRNAPAPRVSVPPKAKAPESTCRSASDIAGSEGKYTHTFPTKEQLTTKPLFLRSRPLDQGSAAGGVAPLIRAPAPHPCPRRRPSVVTEGYIRLPPLPPTHLVLTSCRFRFTIIVVIYRAFCVWCSKTSFFTGFCGLRWPRISSWRR